MNNALSSVLDHWHHRPAGSALHGRHVDGPPEECGPDAVASGFDLRPQKINIVIRTIVNLVILLGLLLGMAVSFGLSSLSTSLADTVVEMARTR